MSIQSSASYPANAALNFAKYKKQVDKIAKGNHLGEFTESACVSNFGILEKHQEQALEGYKAQAALFESLRKFHSRQPTAQQKAAERYNDVLDKLSVLPEDKKAAEEKVANLQQEIKKLEEPCKKLTQELQEIQKSLTQETLDKCSVYLGKDTNADIVFIMEKFVTILRGQSADAQSVELYMKSVEGLNLAISRIDYSVQDMNECKENVKALLGDRAISLGLVVEGADGQLAASGRALPEKMVHFLVFYKLLIKLCKLCIARGDELKIASRVTAYQNKVQQCNIDQRKLEAQKEIFARVLPTLINDPGLAEATKDQANVFMDCQDVVNLGLEALGAEKMVNDDRAQVLDAVESVPTFDYQSAFRTLPISAGPHITTIEQLTGPVEFPEGTQSLCCKYLSREIFDKYIDQKDGAGVPFGQMILSGVHNVDSGIGVYAGSHDTYTRMSEYFDQIIEDYHGHKPEDSHVSDMDHTKLRCPPLSAEDNAKIVSTRIRVGRNLADYALGPGVTKEQRDEIETRVSGVLSNLEGDLRGKYYPLEGMSPEDSRQLIADHFLFKKGDRFLEYAGLNRDWPAGRGIFHNDAKSFLVWVNEEDQLRIISMQKGFDIAEVFSRLSRAAKAIEDEAKFAFDNHLGYITSCPTNLGTALRASVHVKLLKLGRPENKKLFTEIADKYFVQIRGIHGEHSESDDMIFDISNLRRLGRSEVELVQDMYNGVKALLDAERVL